MKCRVCEKGPADGVTLLRSTEMPTNPTTTALEKALSILPSHERVGNVKVTRIDISVERLAAFYLEAQRGALTEMDYPADIYPDGPPMCCNGEMCGCKGMPTEPPLWWGRRDFHEWLKKRIAALREAEEELRS